MTRASAKKAKAAEGTAPLASGHVDGHTPNPADLGADAAAGEGRDAKGATVTADVIVKEPAQGGPVHSREKRKAAASTVGSLGSKARGGGRGGEGKAAKRGAADKHRAGDDEASEKESDGEDGGEVEESEEEDGEAGRNGKAPPAKKARSGKSAVPANGSHQVGRVVYSSELRRPPPAAAGGDGARPLTVLSWNVAGLRALLAKSPDALSGLADREPFLDALCMQEVKLQPSHVDDSWVKAGLREKGFKHVFWSLSEEKLGYSGVAVACRRRPLHVSYGLGHEKHDGEGRVITLEFPEYYLVNAYVPNSGEGLRRLDYRTKEWDVALADHVIALNTVGRRRDAVGKTTAALEVDEVPPVEGAAVVAVTRSAQKDGEDEARKGGKKAAGGRGKGSGAQTQIKAWFVGAKKGQEAGGKAAAAATEESELTPEEAARLGQPKPVVLTGDLNCAREEIDIHNPRGNLRSAGFTQEERDSFAAQLLGRARMADSFRRQHPQVVGYTYYSYRFNARARGNGWRLDYFMVSEDLAPRVHDSFILNDVTGSDHVPLGITITPAA